LVADTSEKRLKNLKKEEVETISSHKKSKSKALSDSSDNVSDL